MDARKLVSPPTLPVNNIDDHGRVLVSEEEQEAQPDAESDNHNSGEVHGGDEANVEQIEDEEIQKPRRKLGNPRMPSPEEVDEHDKTHLPYRCWCKHCQQGRGVGPQHYSLGQESTIPRIGLDYFYLTKGGIKMASEIKTTDDMFEIDEQRQTGQAIKCLLIKCLETKNIFAYVVPAKGVDEDGHVVNLIVRAVQWIGHTRFIFKADNERAMKAIIDASYKALRLNPHEGLEGVSKEDSAKYDSRSNGATEAGIRSVRGLFRTLKLDLEGRIGKIIPLDHAVIPWMMEHAALLLSALMRKSDGLTPWQTVRGRPFGMPLMIFGESVLWKQPDKGPGHNTAGNSGPRMLDGGIFIGFSRTSNTYMIATDNGVEEARGVQRKPVQNRWDEARISGLKATPWEMRTKHDTEVVFAEPTQKEPEPVEHEVVPRQMRITKHDCQTYGFTEGCAQCDWIMRYGQHKSGLNHTEVCRKRIMEAMTATPHGKSRIERHEERTGRYLAESIERAQVAHDGAAAQQPIQDAASQPAINIEAGDAPMDDDDQPNDHGQPDDDQSGMDIGNVNTTQRDSAPSNHLSGSTEGWLPRADDGSHAETQVSRPEQGSLGVHATMSDGRGRAQASRRGAPISRRTVTSARPATAANIEAYCRGLKDRIKPATAIDEPVFVGHVGFLGNNEDPICNVMMNELGSGKSFMREKRQACQRVITEVYSPPRVSKMAARSSDKLLLPGFAFDITTVDPDDGLPWDFDQESKRSKARKLIASQKPLFIVGSPMCKAFSTWQALNRAKHGHDKTRIRREMTKALVHVNFVVELYRDQIARGCYFLHEHPLHATSWQHDPVKELLARDDVQLGEADQCQYGAEAVHGKDIGKPLKKPTGFMSNAPELVKALSKRCSGRNGQCSRAKGGTHTPTSGRTARDSERYSDELCRAILHGMRQQMRSDGILQPGCYGLQAREEEQQEKLVMKGPEQGYTGKHRDDLTGQILKDEGVDAARAKELAYFHAKNVWKVVPKSNAYQATGRGPISVRWVDVNKGDDQSPNYRSRLVARQLKAHDHSGQSFFAPAPPIEALRTVLSLSQTRIGSWNPDWDPNSPKRVQISTIDVSRAYFNAKVEDDTPCFVQLPSELGAGDGVCGQLLRHMYGTRMAADGWQEEYSTLLVSLGFVQGVSCPNVFRHVEREVVCSVHGDDFTSCGPKPSLDWMEKAIGEKYEITIGPRLGPGPDDAKEARVLNRIIRWEHGRIEYEADPRQAERLVAECGLEGCKPMATPGVRATFQELEADEALPTQMHTAFRGASARGNYLSTDRLDAHFACKEICRWMAKPSQQSWKALKRLCRYFAGLPRLIYVFHQQECAEVDIYTDTDWAGCPKTRKSTSGGCLMLGRHTLKHWSSTQAGVSLSSGEAEFHGVVKGAGMGLGYQALLDDLGIEASLRVWTDSSAAIGIAGRQGLGKLRHLDTHTLWLQQAVRSKRLELKKVLGTENPADLFTKHSLSREKIMELVKLFDCKFSTGRAASAPTLRRDEGTKRTMASYDEEQLNNVDEDHNDQHNQPAVMPHKNMSREQLDKEYPSLGAPEDFDAPGQEPPEQLLQAGMQEARDIADAMRIHGRTKRDLSRRRI